MDAAKNMVSNIQSYLKGDNNGDAAAVSQEPDNAHDVNTPNPDSGRKPGDVIPDSHSHSNSNINDNSSSGGVSDKTSAPSSIDLPSPAQSASSSNKDVQSPAQGPDPNLVGDAQGHPKMAGVAEPGSHSAVFGLTPDGKRHDAVSSATTAVGPAHSKHHSIVPKPGAEGRLDGQMSAPDQGPKGLERTDPVPLGQGSDGKPGAGLAGAPMGSGDVPAK